MFPDTKTTTEQMLWFEQVLKEHPSTEGWKVFVFTHAPPNGSGLRVLQENHVVNGCCWLNHSDEKKCSKFIELVREHRCIKAWFSGHFHLGQDYQDSITFPTIDPKDGPYPNRGSCVFVQTVRPLLFCSMKLRAGLFPGSCSACLSLDVELPRRSNTTPARRATATLSHTAGCGRQKQVGGEPNAEVCVRVVCCSR